MKKICNKIDCYLAGIEQNLENFNWANKKLQKYMNECKNCESKRKKEKLKNNKKNSNRPNIPIQIKKCSNLDCLVKIDQYVNADDNLSDFRWRNSTNNYDAICKTCILNTQKIYYIDNKKDVQKYQKKYNAEHKEEKKIYNQKYCKENIEEIRNQKRIYFSKKENKDKKNANQKEKRKIDICFKLRDNISGAIRRGLKENNSSKEGQSCFKYLTYTKEELKLHIENLFEPWMTWNNWGNYDYETWDDNDSTTWTWQLDHIIPHSFFKYTSMDDQEFKDCWSLLNLRPLSAKQNIKEGNRR